MAIKRSGLCLNILEQIEKFRTFDHHLEGMEIDTEDRIYYKQFDLEYQIEGRRDTVKKVDRLKLNLYFNLVRRISDLLDLDVAITTHPEALNRILADRPLWMMLR